MTGFTEAERYLARLAQRSFLSLWSYTNVFRDEFDSKSGSKEGKEVCDLIVVFDKHIILFSDKDCKYGANPDEKVAWRRWYKKSVESSAKQIYGAERWIKNFPDRIFLNTACTIPFPIKIPDLEDMKFHRVAVVHSIANECKRYFSGGSGSLIYDSTISSSEHIDGNCEPFRIGQIDPTKGYVHVLDDNMLEVMMGELDTVSDFVSYLEKKEKLIESCQIIAPGEEELLANFVARIDENGEHNFVFEPKADTIFMEEGFWESYKKNPQSIRKKHADKDSYIWDSLIEALSYHVVQGTQHHTNSPGISGIEPALRMMAQLGRFERRLAGKSLIDFLDRYAYQGTVKASRIIKVTSRPHLNFVLFVLPYLKNKDYEDYRRLRRTMLEVYCLAMKVRYPDLLDIVGLGFDAGEHAHRSEDLMYLDARDWDTSRNAQIIEDMKAFDIFQTDLDKNMRKMGEKEYPDPPKRSIPMKNRDGNKPCPCGSGKKFKKCCGFRI